MQCVLLGTDFSRASVEVREHLAFTPQQSQEFYGGIAGTWPGELLILSTCNRSEFLLVSPSPDEAAQRLLDQLRRLRPHARALDHAVSRYRYSGSEAVRHLMGVAAGLRSKVTGDAQIASQLRQAFEIATDAGAAGPHIREIVTASLRAAKRIRRETGIGTGAASTGAAVLGAIRNEFGCCAQLQVVILGAGQAAADVAAHLGKQRFGSVLIAARKLEAAQELERAARGAAIRWEEAEQAAAAADVVIAAVSSPVGFLGRERLSGLRGERGRRLLLVDLGVPRAIDPGCIELAGVSILDIDRIQGQLAATQAIREQAAGAAERILDQELARYAERQSRLMVEPAIRELYRQADLIRLAVAAQGADSPETARRVMKHLLDGPVRRLRELASRDQASAGLAAWVLTAKD